MLIFSLAVTASFIGSILCVDPGGNKPPNYKDVIFTYPAGVRSERDIPICPTFTSTPTPLSPVLTGPANTHHESSEDAEEEIKQRHEGEAACNLIHKRYFFPPIVERLCRCPDRSECPWVWSQGPQYPNSSMKATQKQENKQQHAIGSKSPPPTRKGDGQAHGGSGGPKRDPNTMVINNRSQLKFCNEVTTMVKCKGKKPSLYRVTKSSAVSASNPIADQQTVTNVTCYCPPLYKHWVFVEKEVNELQNGTTITTISYRCDKLQRCSSLEKCGHIRTDYHSTFYNCSCPANHLCLPQNEEEIEVEEIFYKGPALQAYCTPFNLNL